MTTSGSQNNNSVLKVLSVVSLIGILLEGGCLVTLWRRVEIQNEQIRTLKDEQSDVKGVCVCVCAGVCVCVCACVRACVRVCVCVCV